MSYDLSTLYDKALPQTLNDFLNYIITIKGKSPNTVKGYKADLAMFLRFMLLYKEKISNKVPFEEIDIHKIDDSFLSTITLGDLISFITFNEVHRQNSN